MKRPRILYVQRPPGGGSATGLLDMLRCLDRERFDPVVLFYAPSPYEDDVRKLGGSVLRLFDQANTRNRAAERPVEPIAKRHSTWREIRRLIRLEAPVARRVASIISEHEIALVHHNNNPRANRASILGARMAAVPQVCHVRFLGEYDRTLDAWLSRRVFFYLYMSKAIEGKFRSDVGVSEDHGDVALDPFDFQRLSTAIQSAADVRSELGLANKARVVANVGRLAPWKGQDVFLRAMEPLLAGSETVALVVGGPGEKPAERDFAAGLHDWVRERELDEKVRFLGFRRDAPAIMAASDVVVHSATQPEPFGRVVVEAMATGRPVIAMAAGGPLEIIRDGRTGLLVPPGDAEAMTRAIERLLTDPVAAAEMGRVAKSTVEERHDPSRFAARLHELYQRALETAA